MPERAASSTFRHVHEVEITPRSPSVFSSISGPGEVERLQELAGDLRAQLGDQTIWMVNSTAVGGGVAEMLHSLLTYARGLDVDTRWLVIGGNPDFFRVTKRLHHALHGEDGDGSNLGDPERAIYEKVASENLKDLDSLIEAGDVVVLHDPQTAGLASRLVERGAHVIWRCHIGDDRRTPQAELGWRFLAPYLAPVQNFIFTRATYVPEMCNHGSSLIVAPSIDPFSPKNQEMSDATVRAILVQSNLVAGPSGDGDTRFLLNDGGESRVRNRAEVLRSAGPPSWDTPLVVQVSRWDDLKDPVGVLEGFTRMGNGAAAAGAALVLAGPSVDSTADDPEGAAVFRKVSESWRRLPEEHRKRIHLANLPMEDVQENAAIVNALQRHAAVVVQKSLREGFGLTVTEAMWKARPMVASAVGGILDQIQHGVHGLLLADPTDLDGFAALVSQVLSDQELGARLGRNAREHVGRYFLGLRTLSQYAGLIKSLK